MMSNILTLIDPDKFWSRVVKSRGCWLWNGRDTGRYGKLRVSDGRTVDAHRVSCCLHNGLTELPTLWVLHLCDVRSCCRPSHLRLGTRSDNMKDASERGRLHFQHIFPPTTKLTAKQVRNALQLIRGGKSVRSTAKELGVAKSTMDFIAKGKTWKHVFAEQAGDQLTLF